MSSGRVSGRQLVTRPPIVPSSFDKLQPDRFDQFLLSYEDEDDENFRYKLHVLDINLLATTNIAYATAVFLIPAGREGEYMFSSKNGLASIAESAKCARMIAVSFGRHHVFESQQLVQEELTFVVQLLSRQGKFLPSYTQINNEKDIPFMALDGLGKRRVVAEGQSELSGKYIVEQVQADAQQVRRLYFLDNPFLIQTEVVMKELEGGVYVVDQAHAAFDYHKAVVAGLLALVDSLNHGMLIGLGGGGFVNFLHHVSPDCKITAVELDPAIVAIAKQNFGLDSPSLQGVLVLKIGDGLAIGVEGAEVSTAEKRIMLPPESLSFIVVDVDTKDKTVGMSCPPVSFLDQGYLEQLATLLVPSGVLAINVSARDPSLLNVACSSVKKVFSTVFFSKKNTHEDINVVLLATQCDSASVNDGPFQNLDVRTGDELRLFAHNLSIWTGDSQVGGEIVNNKTRKKKSKSNKRKGGGKHR
ncbi:methyltransferase-like protein 13 [Mayamaea pseudoterrestris]|nr:methyltransferase-like protein 13 [Mayamaea pseudoterrestris]